MKTTFGYCGKRFSFHPRDSAGWSPPTVLRSSTSRNIYERESVAMPQRREEKNEKTKTMRRGVSGEGYGVAEEVDELNG
jgi:hypothetical protein